MLSPETGLMSLVAFIPERLSGKSLSRAPGDAIDTTSVAAPEVSLAGACAPMMSGVINIITTVVNPIQGFEKYIRLLLRSGIAKLEPAACALVPSPQLSKYLIRIALWMMDIIQDYLAAFRRAINFNIPEIHKPLPH